MSTAQSTTLMAIKKNKAYVQMYQIPPIKAISRKLHGTQECQNKVSVPVALVPNIT